MRTKTTPEQFFYDHAGYHYGAGESPDDGHRRCAKELAEAERRGSDAGLSFEWQEDDQTDESFRKTRNPYRLWLCVCRDESGTVLASLGGVDFGAPPADPWSDPYRRVVEAELASEALPDGD